MILYSIFFVDRPKIDEVMSSSNDNLNFVSIFYVIVKHRLRSNYGVLFRFSIVSEGMMANNKSSYPLVEDEGRK